MPRRDLTPLPRNIIDCEGNLLSYPFPVYLRLLAHFAQILKVKEHIPIAAVFYQAYKEKTLTLKMLTDFLIIYQNELLELLKQHHAFISLDKQYLLPETILQLKNPSWRESIATLYKEHKQPIIIATTNPYTQLIADCLSHILPAGSFEILYTKSGPVKNADMRSVNLLLGHGLLIDEMQLPENGGSAYLKRFKQRLVNTGFFDIMQIQPADQGVVLSAPPKITITDKKITPDRKQRCNSPSFWKLIKESGGQKVSSPLRSENSQPRTPPRLI